jgi:sugar lactone lactonase YvrE
MGSLGLGHGLSGASAPSAAVHTVASRLSAPSGLAFDPQGDLFIAETDQCRVVMVPSESGIRYGHRVRALHPTVVAGSRCGAAHGVPYPTGLAVNAQGALFIAEAAADRVVVLDPGSRRLVTVAGTGHAGFDGDGGLADRSQLDQPTGIALNAQGDLFIADTANCRVREVPAADTTFGGQQLVELHVYTVAGTGVCGSAGRGGPATTAQLWNPIALAFDRAGNLFVSDNGDQSVLEVARARGTDYGTPIGTGDMAVVIGGTGSNQPYLADGLPAVGSTAELNDPEGLAVSSTGTLFVADGTMQAIKMVPAVSGPLFGRPLIGGNMYTLAGALTVTDTAGTDDGTRWILTNMGRPTGIALAPDGSAVFYSDATTGQVREIS